MSIITLKPISFWRLIWNSIIYNRYNIIYKIWFKLFRSKKFSKFIFPIINQTMPVLLVDEIILVQPMTDNGNQYFYMDCVYKRKNGGNFGKRKK